MQQGDHLQPQVLPVTTSHLSWTGELETEECFLLTGLAYLCWQGALGELAFWHARNGMQYGP